MDEFSLIDRFWKPLGDAITRSEVIEGIGNDGAVVRCPPGQNQVVTMDTLLEGVHFPRNMPPHALGWRALAVNLSDLAAMGAEPLCFTLSVTLPEASESWLAAFADGIGALAVQENIQLVGGDTTRGPLSITIQAQGLLPDGSAVRRGSAQVGDRICVSGTLGEAGEALNWLDAADAPAPAVSAMLERYRYPQPRLALGQWLREAGACAVDVSDGLLADLGHLLVDRGACVDWQALPVSPELVSLRGADGARRLAASAGDDYELLYTWPLDAPAPSGPNGGTLPQTVIGTVTQEAGVTLLGPDGRINIAEQGYTHFGAHHG
ncbi:thiamine-phosphate kinase [Salicola sp. Rm-C-2C1-2]|uniref:thiamine-phosphate kinase n=1 Tax=Salicola sp. Rm-C-2C1-2 TaxID=3141321 RepID=UPI0032E4148D